MAYNEIQFKGFRLVRSIGSTLDSVLSSLKDERNKGILFLVRTENTNKDGFLVLNGKVYGSAENLRASMDENLGTLEKSLNEKIGEIDSAITAITGNTGTIYTKITEAINKLDATVETSGTKYISGTIEETDGKLTSFNINEKGLTDKFNDIDSKIEAITGDTSTIDNRITNAIEALDATVSGTSTHSGITVTIGQVDGKLNSVTVEDSLGTASKKNVAEGTLSLPTGETSSTKDGLTTAAQVENFVKASVADLTGAMHFKGVVSNKPGVADYKAGDVILVGTKEYVLNETGGVKSWVELGDEGLYVTKGTTIAGVDLQDNITADELRTALKVANGAQVNVLEGVKVNGTKLNITNKEVDITVTTGTTEGTISVNGANVAVTGLKSAAYVDTTAFDASGTAETEIAKISGSTSGESTNKYVTVTTTQKAGKVTGITVNDSALKDAITGITNDINTLSGTTVTNVNNKTGNTITLTGVDIAVGSDVDGTGGTMTSGSTVSAVLTDIYSKLNTTKADAYTGITAANNTVTVNPTTHGHSVAVNLKQLSPDEKASGLIQLVNAEDGSGIYGQLFFDGTESSLIPE